MNTPDEYLGANTILYIFALVVSLLILSSLITVITLFQSIEIAPRSQFYDKGIWHDYPQDTCPAEEINLIVDIPLSGRSEWISNDHILIITTTGYLKDLFNSFLIYEDVYFFFPLKSVAVFIIFQFCFCTKILS